MTAPRAEGTALERAMEALAEFSAHSYCGASWYSNGDPLGTLQSAQRHARTLLAALRSRDADIAAAVSAEREQCALELEAMGDMDANAMRQDTLYTAANAIRARREGGSDATGQ